MKFTTKLLLALLASSSFLQAGMLSTPGNENVKLYIAQDETKNSKVYMNDAYLLLKQGFNVYGIKSFECENDPFNLCLERNNRPLWSLIAVQDGKLLDYTEISGVKYPIITETIIDKISPDDVTTNTKGEIIIKARRDISDNLTLSEYRNAISTKLRPMLLKQMTNQVKGYNIDINEKAGTITINNNLYGNCENYDEILKEFKESKFTIVDNPNDANYIIGVAETSCVYAKSALAANKNKDGLEKNNWYADNEVGVVQLSKSSELSSNLVSGGSGTSLHAQSSQVKATGNAVAGVGAVLGVISFLTAERNLIASNTIFILDQNSKKLNIVFIESYKGSQHNFGSEMYSQMKVSASGVVNKVDSYFKARGYK